MYHFGMYGFYGHGCLTVSVPPIKLNVVPGIVGNEVLLKFVFSFQTFANGPELVEKECIRQVVE